MEHLARYQYRKYLLLIEAGLVVSFLVYPSFSSGQANPPQQALEKANTLLKQGQAESAESIYRQLLKSSPKSLAARLALGRIALRKGDYLQARQQFERALADHPDSAEAAAESG
jgi:tetratricopeptide (TPR) repeat protein